MLTTVKAAPSRLQALVHDSTRILRTIERDHAPAAFASSFGAEDMVLLDLIATRTPSIRVLTLDTGRLPAATLELMARARERYAIPITVVTPDRHAVEDYVQRHGIDGFYDGIEQRRACCHVRKVQPLARALHGQRAWITGLRREQSDNRAQLAVQELDAVHGIPKFNPLVEWTTIDVWAYIRQHDIPYNALHDRGYPSIGCEPCTRAIRPGEPLRAGRWWWESQSQKECGLHVVPIRVASTAGAAQ